MGWRKLISDIGFTMSGDIDMGDNDISDIKSLAFNDGGATVTQVTDDDSLGTSDTVLCTQGNVKAYVDRKFNTVESHNYYTTGSAGYYIPFGGSATESSATTYSYTDDTVFIAPYDGKLVKLYLYNDYSTDKDPLFTNCYLRVNGTLGAVLNGIGAANWNWQTSLQYTCDQNNTFDRGDILRVMVDPQKAPYYVALTSVWEWNM